MTGAELYVGVMSGTSQDGVDVAVCRWAGDAFEVVAFGTRTYADAERSSLAEAIDRGGAAELCDLHRSLGEIFASAVLATLEEAGVDPTKVGAIGSHGHTVWHRPPSGTRRGATLQLGDPATLAARTRIAVVSDFRTADMAAGGHGAPLVPWADRILFGRPDRNVALQNLGGMANVTWLPATADGDEVIAFDTGPGNALIDLAVQGATGGGRRFDEGGAAAQRGRARPELLHRLLAHPFFRIPPPRSTGREEFGEALVAEVVRELGLEVGHGGEGWDDLVATLTELTARSIAQAYRAWIHPRPIDEVVLTGGGAHNPVLVEAIERALADISVTTGAAALGIDPDAREAVAFALLAKAHLEGRPGNLPHVTGASGPRVLGSLTPAPQEEDG